MTKDTFKNEKGREERNEVGRRRVNRNNEKHSLF